MLSAQQKMAKNEVLPRFSHLSFITYMSIDILPHEVSSWKQTCSQKITRWQLMLFYRHQLQFHKVPSRVAITEMCVFYVAEITSPRVRTRITELTTSPDKRVQNLAYIFIQVLDPDPT